MNGAEYPVYYGKDPNGQVTTVTTVAAIEGDDASAPPVVIPFGGFAVPIHVAIAEVNRLVPSPDAGQRVLGMCSLQVAVNDVSVYGHTGYPLMNMSAALRRAAHVVDVLIAHPVRWWRRDDWFGRPVWYQGVPATITDFVPISGRALLTAEQGRGFRRDAGDVGEEEPVVALVDIIDGPEVCWVRQ